jgi:uncharacterized membrane protein YhhN
MSDKLIIRRTTMIMILFVLAFVLLVGLLVFEKGQNRKGLLPTKTVLSLLFIVTAVSQIHLIQPYTLFIIIGLLFCLGGDVFLALPQERMFLFGLVSFLLGHVCYVIGFIWIAGPSNMTLIGAIVTIVLSGLVYIWLKPHLGTMKKPVIAYILVISFMFISAWSVLGMPRQPFMARLLVFAGAACFYISDIFVARDRFLKNAFVNRLLGLPLYYLAQFMIAFSIGMVR